MKTVELLYYASFGSGDSSDYMDWEIELTDEEEALYNKAVSKGIPFDEIPELAAVLDRAYEEILSEEIAEYIEMEDEYVMETLGLCCVDADELNELVHKRDSHALQFFGLENATDEELSAWDANALEKLPMVKDFVEDFEPGDPFEEGYSLTVEFVEPDNFGEFEFDDEDEDEAE